MQGHKTLWVPGVDHAGIATQVVAERHLFAKTGLTRHDIGREEFLKHVWEWKNTYGNKICAQLR
jgi:valyl-tRNA synthetase